MTWCYYKCQPCNESWNPCVSGKYQHMQLYVYIFLCTMMVCCHLQKVQAFPGDQHVHADPSCLSLPSLQQLLSHHGFQQVPITHTHSQLHYVARIGYNVHADTKTIYAMDVEQSKLFSVLFLCLYGFIVLTAAPLAPADPTGPEGPPGPYRQGKTRMSEASR